MKLSKIFRRTVGSIIMIPVCLFALFGVGCVWLCCWFIEDEAGMKEGRNILKEYWPPYVYKQIWSKP